MNKSTRQQFKEFVISSIHGMPYEEAVKKEKQYGAIEVRHYRNQYDENGEPSFSTNVMYIDNENVVYLDDQGKPNMDYWNNKTEFLGLPITIGRVMQALKMRKCIKLEVLTNKEPVISMYKLMNTQIGKKKAIRYQRFCTWQLVKENGQEADDDFQSDETIEALYNLLKKD